MKKSFKQCSEQLFNVAQTQSGFFTAKQAEKAGFDAHNFTYHVKVGNWERACRGVYRLSNYPMAEHPDLIIWSLWSRGRDDVPKGVYSHETALSIFNLSDVMPSKLHMTVPSHFRRSAKTPKILVLYYADLQPEEIRGNEEYKVTRPLKAILDLCKNKRIEDQFLLQALAEGKTQGLITQEEIKKNRDQLLTLLPKSRQLLKTL
jgi:predicted transcriptional regulator of viral defense system